MNHSASALPFGCFLAADALIPRYAPPALPFTVGWAAALLQDDALAVRLVNALQNARPDHRREAAKQWQLAVNALREWHTTGPGAGFISFMFAVHAFYGALLADDTLLQMRLCHEFRAQCSAMFPTTAQLPLQLPITPRHPEGIRA